MSNVTRPGLPAPVVVVVLWVGSAALCYAAIRDLLIAHREGAWTSVVLALAFVSMAVVRTVQHFRSTKDAE